jgi:agmatine/peptidylarginine deiminase
VFPKTSSSNETAGLYPEFETSGALVLGLNELIEHHPKTLVDIMEALDDRIPVVGVVADESQGKAVQARLMEAGAPTKNLSLVIVPVVGMWIRDYGPSFVRLPDGVFYALDALYVRRVHAPDDWIPRYLAGYFRLPVADVPLRLNGGNLLANGRGLLITTTQVIEFNVRDGYNQNEIAQHLNRYYGATDWIVLKPLAGEPTGHVDMFLTLVAPNEAVLGAFDPADDPINAERLDEAAAQLSKTETHLGPMKVTRIPMPSHVDGKWRTYTNVIFANETLLVPIYPDVSPDLDRRALEIYSELMPNRRIVPIDASTLIEKNGSLHCISINVPKLEAN